MNKYLYTLGQILKEDYPDRDISSDDKISDLINGHIDEMLWVLTILKMELIYGVNIPDQLADKTELTLEEFTDELSQLQLIPDKIYPEFYDIKIETIRLSKELIDIEYQVVKKSDAEVNKIHQQFELLDDRLKILLGNVRAN